MQIPSVNVQPILGQALGMRGAVFVLGKVCLVAAVFLALEMGDSLRLAGRVEAPDVDLSITDDSLSAPAKQDFQAYNIIISRNIFGAKAGKGDEGKGAQPVTSLKLRLVGTNISAGSSSIAIIENSANKEQDVFELNSMVFDQAKLVEIQTEGVKLERNGTIEALLLEGSQDGGQPAGAPSSEAGGETKTEFTVSEEELNNELANLPRLLSQARAVPYFRNGKSVGMRLFAIRAQSLYEKLGLKNGDIIKSVNNNSLADPAQALKLFEQLKSERSVTVKTEREGQDIDLSYTIR